MAEKRWTKPQQQAIEARGGTLLVSAAAGSGKTAVLVERVVGLLCDPDDPVPADQLLIVTFSRAAAAEMKQRIAARLQGMLQQRPGDAHLLRQHALLGKASISTVHAFCADLIRQNFQHLELSPDFEILDERELSILMEDAILECLEGCYEQAEPAFHALVELLSTARSDQRLIETVFSIYQFSRSHPFFETWLEEKLALYDPEVPPAESPWGKTLLRYARETLEYCRGALGDMTKRMEEEETPAKAYLPAFYSDLAGIEDVLGSLNAGEWDGVVQRLGEFKFQTLGRSKESDNLKVLAKGVRDDCKKIIQKLAEQQMNTTEQEYREDLEALRPILACLFRLTGEFAVRLDEKKSEKRRLDYADLEHHALRLLLEPDGSGGHRTTAHAARIAAGFRHILVDEYQDSNEVQEYLFESVSRKGENLFLVGDVKQSIYGFRQAMPQLFLRRREEYTRYDGETFPATILLDTNFRSRREVTGGINYLFELLMNRELGGLDYGEEDSLKCGATYPNLEEREPEFLLLDTTGSTEDPSLLEARLIAGRIRRMLEEGYQVTEGDITRSCEPRDFCILMRSPSRRARVYLTELQRQDIPGQAVNSGGFLVAREVAGVVSLLRALNNPLLDIELAAAMLSPLFSFDDDDLAQIRLSGRNMALYTAVCKAAEEGDEKCTFFLRDFRYFRQLCATLPVDELLLRIYATTGALEAVAVMPRGETRRANLLLLIQYAADYHTGGYKGIGRFVGLLDRLQEQGGDLEPTAVAGEGGNAVQLLSVHRSKGLEFPVVFLADTGRRFNVTDLNSPTLLHPEFGFACVRRDPEQMVQYPTLPMGAIRVEARRTMLSEEMRILYVALTRAKEKLIVTAAVKDAPKRIRSCGAMLLDGRLPPFVVSGKNCYADWLLMALLHHPDGDKLRVEGGLDQVDIYSHDSRWKVAVVTPEEKEEEEDSAQRVRTHMPDPQLLQQMGERLAWQYPHLSQTRIPLKLAVSDVAKGGKEVSHRFGRRPRFLTGKGLTPAERGSAMHKFMQFADYENARDNLEDEIRRMREDQFLLPVEVSSLSRRRLREFFHGPLAQRIFQSKHVMRELRFMAQFGREELGELYPEIDEEGRISLQGVADCVFLEEDGAVIVDYKTDWIVKIEELAERYRNQVLLYRAILSDTLGVPVKECILYSFTLSQFIAVS